MISLTIKAVLITIILVITTNIDSIAEEYKCKNISNEHKLTYIKLNDKCGIIDVKGKIVVPPEYDKIGAFCDDVAEAYKDNKQLYLTKGGQLVDGPNECMASKLYSFEGSETTNAGIHLKGYKNYTGKIIVEPKYTSANKFNGSFAKVALHGKIGFINNKGEEVVPLKYRDVHQIDDRYFKVFDQNITSSVYDVVERKIIDNFEEVISILDNGEKILVRNKEVIRVDAKGNKINGFTHKLVGAYIGGLIRFEFELKNIRLFGFIDKSDKVVIQSEYRYVDEFYEKYIFAETTDHKKIYIDNKGEVLKTPDNIKTMGKFLNRLSIITDAEDDNGYMDDDLKTVSYILKKCGKDVYADANKKVIWPEDYNQVCKGK